MKNILLILCLLSLGACGGSGSSGGQSNPPPDSTIVNFAPKSKAIMTADAQAMGFDLEKLTSTYQQAASQPFARSLLVLKDNHLVAEAYFNGRRATDLHHVRSITKTITACLIGIAIEQGVLGSIEQTLGEFLLEDYPGLSNAKAHISIKQLLTMTSGFLWDESGSGEFEQWVTAADPVGYLLQRPLSHTPGTRFNYNSASSHLLSAILSKAFNDDQDALQQFATTHFFAPLGITRYAWEKLADGRPNGSADLQLKAEDSAKIGLLIANEGFYPSPEGQGQQIVPRHFMHALKTPSFTFEQSWGAFDGKGFGYLFWLGEGEGKLMELAWGWAGQMIVHFPDQGLVVVVNNDHQAGASEAERRDTHSFSLIIAGALAALDGGQ